MKKVILTTAIIFAFCFGMVAQNDNFFNDWKNIDDRGIDTPVFPQTHGSFYDSNETPLGSGVLILSTLGVGFVILKRKGGEKL